MIAAAILIAVHGLLSIPSYIYLQTERVEQQQILTKLTAQLSAQNVQSTNAHLKTLNNDTTLLTKLAEKPSASKALQKILKIPRKGITLSSMTYTAATTAHANAITISGVAQTRTSLQKYQQAFGQASFIKKVDLPVNVYAKDTNIKFTMTLTETFTP